MIKISNIIKESCVDGVGLRYVIFVQGCPHHCKGCHNPNTWAFNKDAKVLAYDEIYSHIKENPLLSGITLSGGEPCSQMPELIRIIDNINRDFPHLNIWAYSGYTYEQILELDHGREYLSKIDVLVDGKFELENKTYDLPFRGSSNQRILYPKKLLNT